MVCAHSPVLPLFTFTTQHSVQGNQYCQDCHDETFISLAISNIWWNILREQFGSLGVQIITITDVSGVWDTAQSGHTWQLQSDSLPHYCQCVHQSEVSREVTWPDILQSESLSTLLTVSGHFNISTTSHQQRKWDRIYRLVSYHVYYSLWSISWMNMNTDWILFMRMSWHCSVVSDGYFTVLLDNWIIVVSELSWFLINLW